MKLDNSPIYPKLTSESFGSQVFHRWISFKGDFISKKSTPVDIKYVKEILYYRNACVLICELNLKL